MANRLFQEARKRVDLAKQSQQASSGAAMEKAKNALSSAYANSTAAEQMQLHDMQKELDQIK
ncbi:DUF3813 domain-containing protein [Falsibacillus pallidus]|uniref:Uncharacterized protein DUF3813 n=1 Tax=Falsibacillus pallidus TaxID=493781 RepID=A0A370GYT4_9BACI|nr:DUF3813 domain-containing protein [Falsibacillus pallidus]RDI47794.1 uncharacterized protein DUF3813 [Falsibacillus pallidus]